MTVPELVLPQVRRIYERQSARHEAEERDVPCPLQLGARFQFQFRKPLYFLLADAALAWLLPGERDVLEELAGPGPADEFLQQGPEVGDETAEIVV